MRSIRIHQALLFTLGSLVGTTAALAQTIIPAGFGAMSATQPSRTTAVLSGTLLSTGGQNPTVKIRWGDEDQGTAVNPTYAWDNEVEVSTDQAAGTFSTTIAIPNLEKVYYFRAIASNSGGTVVSRSLGVLLPSAPVGVANLQGRWNFDAENANDSSSTGRHGTAKKLFSPSELSNLSLWLDAEDTNSFQLSGSNITKWYNKAGNGYIFDQKTGDPSRTVVNGKNVVNFDGNDQLWTNDAFLASNFTILSVSRLTGGLNKRLISSKDRNWLAGYWNGRVDKFFF
jgi:hypothetical protein